MSVRPRRVLVTGAGGFIGHHLCRALAARGDDVTGLDLHPPEFEPSPARRFVVHDGRDPGGPWQGLFEGQDEVYACAADMGGMGYISSHHATIMRNNGLLDLNTLEAARRAGVGRLLFPSSACIYPDRLQDAADAPPLREDMAYPAAPEGGYGWEKLYTEQLCHYYGEEFGLKVRIARLHNVYGPQGAWRGGREKAPAALCRKVAEAVVRGLDHIEIWGDGAQSRSFCYVDDCVDGLLRLAASDESEPVNIGRNDPVSVNALAELVMQAAGVELRKVPVPGPQGVRGRNADETRARERLGWVPRVDLRTGIARTYAWVEAQVRAAGTTNPDRGA